MNGYWQRGFSLLELLVTLFVIVLVTSLVTLNVTSSGRDIELEAMVDDIAGTAAYALDEAQFVGRDFGLIMNLQSEEGASAFHYRWVQRGDKDESNDSAGVQRWVAPEGGQDVFAAGALPVEIELELELDEVLQDQAVFTLKTEAPPPQLVFYASGETTPGALLFRTRENGDLLWRLEWDLLGNFESLPDGLPREEQVEE